MIKTGLMVVGGNGAKLRTKMLMLSLVGIMNIILTSILFFRLRA
jgi:hypothetical protein